MIEISLEIGLLNILSVINCLCNPSWNSLKLPKLFDAEGRNFLWNIDISFFYYPIENSTANIAKHGIALPHPGQAGIKLWQMGRLQEAACGCLIPLGSKLDQINNFPGRKLCVRSGWTSIQGRSIISLIGQSVTNRSILIQNWGERTAASLLVESGWKGPT